MRVTRTRAVLVAVLLSAVAFIGWRKHETRELEHRLGGIASEIARRPVRVHCQGAVGAALDVTAEAGTVWFDENGRPADVTDLKHDICRRLDRYGHDRSGPGYACVASGTACPLDTIKTIHALHTLAHEAWHLEGVRSESTTECYAIQTTALVAERLGTSPEEAQAAARVALYQIYPQMPSDYQTSDCRDGSPLDLHRSSPVWP